MYVRDSLSLSNGEGKCVVARAHPESDSATDAGTNRCPQGVGKMSQIRSEGSGNVLYNVNHLTAEEVGQDHVRKSPINALGMQGM